MPNSEDLDARLDELCNLAALTDLRSRLLFMTTFLPKMSAQGEHARTAMHAFGVKEHFHIQLAGQILTEDTEVHNLGKVS